MCLEEKLGKQRSRYVSEKPFEPITKTVTDTNEETLEQSEATTLALKDNIENLV